MDDGTEAAQKYVQKIAWLQAIPDKEPKKNDRKTRASTLERVNPDSLTLPEVQSHQRLIKWMNEIGYYQTGAAGPVEVPWSEIQAWSQMTGTEITHKEALALKNLSRAYVSQYHKSSDPLASDPTKDEAYNAAMAAANIEAAFG